MLKFNPVRSRSAKNLTDAIKCSQDSVPSSTSPTTPMDEEGDYYNEKMLQYVHFVHCVSMLERLLLHKKGRELFPVELPGRNGGSVELGQQLLFGNNKHTCTNSVVGVMD